MRATAKLVNAINGGSIRAHVLSDRFGSPDEPGRPLNHMGGLDSAYVLDPVALTLTVQSGAGHAPCSALAVHLPGWTTPSFPWAMLDLNLNVITSGPGIGAGSPGTPSAPFDMAAVSKMAAAGYFA
jgi:hypothetical protein